MPEFVICRGCPASGKTTWAKKQQGYVRLNRDDIRRELFNFGQWKDYRFTKVKEERVTKVFQERMASYAAAGKYVICDDTNLNARFYNRLYDSAVEMGFMPRVVEFFDVPLHKLVERNINREYSVPEDVVHQMFRNQVKLQDRVIKETPGLPFCIICDVDGTIADMGKGEKWGRMPFDWDKVGNDKPKHNVISTVRDWESRHHKIIYLTGRDGVALDKTKEWINLNVYGGQDSFKSSTNTDEVYNRDYPEIFIRKAGDIRPDCDIKEELIREHVLPRYNIRFCIDDRKQMVDHWRALGLETWQVDAGRF